MPTTAKPCQLHILRNCDALLYSTMRDLLIKARSSGVNFSNAPLPLYPAVEAQLVYHMGRRLVGFMVQTGTPEDTRARILRLLDGWGTVNILCTGDASWVGATVKEKDWKLLMRVYTDCIRYPIVL